MRYFQEPGDDKPSSFPCGICSKTVGKRMKAVQCDLCNYWNHIKCDNVDNKTYESLKKSDQSQTHFCKICKEEIFAFQTLSDEQYITSIVKDININENLNLKTNPTPALKVLINDLENHDNDEESIAINCNYYDFSTPIPNSKKNNNSMFHLNLASLGLHKEELVTSLSLLNFEFDVIAVTETKIRAGKTPIFDPSLEGYQHFQTPTECAKGGTIIYTKNDINRKRREDLEKIMYKSRELESVFIEVINEGKKNKIYGCIYRHPSMEIDEFNKTHLGPLLEKLSREKKNPT